MTNTSILYLTIRSKSKHGRTREGAFMTGQNIMISLEKEAVVKCEIHI